MAPDLRRKVDANRAARLAREEASKRQADAQVGNLPHPTMMSLRTKKINYRE